MRKITIVTFLFILAVSLLKAQDVGIHFEKSLSWQQVLDKAKNAHKYIFVDCYATWCGPCKVMDQQVYPLKAVGDLYNKDFISVKVQMDRTAKDSDSIKAWYDVVRYFENTYSVNAYPTFLFFDENGNAVHKGVGSLQVNNFIQLASDAQNPNKQYFRIVKNFAPGTIDTGEEKELIHAFSNSDKNFAGTLTADYLSRKPLSNLSEPANIKLEVQFQDDPTVLRLAVKSILSRAVGDELQVIMALSQHPQVKKIAKDYINRLADDSLYTPKMLVFIGTFTDTSTDRGFDIFYYHRTRVDQAVGNHYFAMDHVIGVITKEFFELIFRSAKATQIEPDWKSLYQQVSQKFDTDYARMLVINGKLAWFSYLARTKNEAQYWPDYITARVAKMQLFRYDTLANNWLTTNDLAWEVFQHGETSQELRAAADWMRNVVRNNPNQLDCLDTYACVLYKAGQVEDALAIEQRILIAAREKNDNVKIDHTQKSITKMRAREKIWEEKEYQ